MLVPLHATPHNIRIAVASARPRMPMIILPCYLFVYLYRDTTLQLMLSDGTNADDTSTNPSIRHTTF